MPKPQWLVENPNDASLLLLVPGGKFLAGGSGSDEGGGKPFEVELPGFLSRNSSCDQCAVFEVCGSDGSPRAGPGRLRHGDLEGQELSERDG